MYRHHHLTVLAGAWWLTRRDDYAEVVDDQLRSWWRENPFLSGVHRGTPPTGDAQLQVSHGLDYAIAERRVGITKDGNTMTIALKPLRLPAQYGHFASADLHVHMNYGGHYHNTPLNLIEQARAEHLDAVYNLIVNKEERIPDIGTVHYPAAA